MRADGAIEVATGLWPRFVRPTNGDFNEQTMSVSKELSLENAVSTVDPKDWQADRVCPFLS